MSLEAGPIGQQRDEYPCTRGRSAHTSYTSSQRRDIFMRCSHRKVPQTIQRVALSYAVSVHIFHVMSTGLGHRGQILCHMPPKVTIYTSKSPQIRKCGIYSRDQGQIMNVQATSSRFRSS